MDKNAPHTDNNIEEGSLFSFKDFLKLCLQKWLWIAICLVCAVGISLFYIYRKQPVFERYEQLLVTDQDSNGGMGDVSGSFSSLGLFSKKTNVYNELISMKSPAVMYVVADSLQLYMNYFMKDGMRVKTLYGSSLPFRIDMIDIDSQEGGGFKMRVNADGSKTFFKFYNYVGGKKTKYKDKIEIAADVTEFDSPIGRIQINPNPRYAGGINKDSYQLSVAKMSMQNTVESYSNKLKGDLVDQDADVIELSIKDVSVERAVDILNNVLNVYNQNWVNDKNKMAVATSKFIDERLHIISGELGDVDRNIADYMKSTGTPDLQTLTKTKLELGSRIEQELISTSSQLSVAMYMKDFLDNPANKNSLLPVNLGIDNPDVAAQIMAYNEVLLQRNNIAGNSSETNPLVMNYDNQLIGLRAAVEKSVDNQVQNLQNATNSLKKEIAKMSSSMSNVPEVSLPLLSEERQQMVKENLYLFLLQKREENELSQKFSADNVRMITPPVGSLNPVAPRKGLIIVIAGILGFGIPIVLLYFLETTNTTVRSRKDLENIKLPFAGEIPQVGKKTKLKVDNKIPFKRNKDEKPPLAVVEEGKRDVVNEAFRVVRGNLDFMSGRNTGPQVIMLTSFNPGSGKSFIAYNLALSFCIKGKRVLVIDCDLRHGSSSMFVGMPHKGLTNYLSGTTDDWKGLVVKAEVNPNLSILPIGKMPPNPAELLENGRLGTIIEQAKEDYDIIFLDCPPVNIVVDTQLVAKYADRTLFVVRAGLLERSALKELNEFYEEKKFNNMSLILNGTEAIHSRYYTYGNYQNLN
ncbi:MAG: polysaccharide biosynthesis tyrosine autokinase [Muribaculaceae bacterium]|nr:polysaccharide biosynthesis tyrosine autokinase [Muribaculaceae bacterium]